MKDLAKAAFDLAAEIHGVQSAAEPEAFIGINEAAELLGYGTHHVKTLCRKGRIPHHQPRPGAHYRSLVSELQAWMRGEWKEEK